MQGKSAKVIHITSLQDQADASLESAKQNFRLLLERSPWLRTLDKEAIGLAKDNSSVKAKYGKLLKLADRIGEAMAPVSACTKGCSHCCHRSVAISQHEAERISEASGRPIKKVERPKVPTTVAEDAPTSACPFLRNHECTIYENRPISCRVNFNISADAFYCDPDLAPPGSQPPTLKMDAFLMAYAIVFGNQPISDIRNFFELVV